MRKGLLFVVFGAVVVLACGPKKSAESYYVVKADSTSRPGSKPLEPARSIAEDNLQAKILATVPENITPVLGYRFKVGGDFDGDGRSEQLTEHFVSRITKTETNKFYEGLENYDQLVALTVEKQPTSYAVSDAPGMDTLRIASDLQLLGLAYLTNVGDLNGDGADEISYVVNWADWSSVNSCRIATLRNNHWQDLYTFQIRDWQLPTLPGELGSTQETGASEAALKAFAGFVKKIRTNVIRVRMMDMGDEKDSVIDLSKVR